MKSVIVQAKGSFDHVVIEELDKPVIQPNQVLVKVYAAGVNPVDFKVVLNDYFPFPVRSGSDIAGVVVELGSEVQQFKVGDEVIGSLEWKKQGAFTEYIATEEKYITHKPVNLSFTESAGIPLAALTAWQALFDTDKLDLQKGQRVVIQAAAGGVGFFALQFAKWAGAHVIAVASARNADFLLAAGADEVIDYTKHALHEVIEPVDAVLNSIASVEVEEQCFKSLKKGGRYVSITITPNPEKLAEYGIHGSRFLFHSNQAQLKKIVELVEGGIVKVVIDKTFPLTVARAALEYVHAGRTRGKVVLVNQPS